MTRDMTTDSPILTRLRDIVSTYFEGASDAETPGNEFNVLQRIISESTQAIQFVSLIEEEFEIEFDDDEINLDFFSSLNTIETLIKRHTVSV